jgi:hypothetical protein
VDSARFHKRMVNLTCCLLGASNSVRSLSTMNKSRNLPVNVDQ